jgi:light-regulated signal transduction histidine kinase (bacteriophytochrome)
VLIVDDNPDMRAYLARLLSDRYHVDAAEDGEVALEAARSQRPDLVLSDVMMPKMDGVALLGRLRADPKTRDTPVVLLSARAGEESLLEGLATGADDYLVKPFSARELLARVKTHVDMARQRREWTGQLERANEELEAFSYSVSHDLRAPVRTIEGFAAALLQDHRRELSDEALHLVERMGLAGKRMAQLIDDLLTLARITQEPIRRRRVDVTELARKVLSELHERDETREVDSRVEPGLAADADPRLLSVVFENLVGNAWKFTSKKPSARIEVRQELQGDERVFFVRDNGAGFDMTYAKRLFVPFQRFHAISEFDGTGIGLATVRRIVVRHGVRIWAEAARDRGATIFFTLGEAR